MFIGIDVSKLTLDVFLLGNHLETHYQIKNQPRVIKTFLEKVIRENPLAKIHLAMENTGYYNWPCYKILEFINITTYVINPLHLKRSMGLTRGKNDKIDAHRIAKFISTHKESLKATIIPRAEIKKLQALIAFRKRLIDTKTKMSVAVKELSAVADNELKKQITQSTAKLVNELNQQLKKVETNINDLIKQDESLNELFIYITSVQGVGKVLAWNLLVKTNEFKSINDARKLACYAGVVPFDFQSGTSISKKPRVSYMADKGLKKLLHMSALRVTQLKGDLQDYYKRKVGEGKNKMCVINALRNKIVARICSVVNNKKIYQIDLVTS